MEIGKGPYGRRRCIPILSGAMTWNYLNGEVGADFMCVYALCLCSGIRVALTCSNTHVNMSTRAMLLRAMTALRYPPVSV